MDDPWERLPLVMPAQQFGRGSVRDFRWYFEGKSRVHAGSLDAVCDWLLDCEYVSDPELFQLRDFWQHPRTFEWLRRGDCEDHALWAWRKLVELGLDAEFVCGRWDPTRQAAGGHAWVVFRDAGAEFVLETVAHDRAAMVRPIADARAEYRPHAAVDARFRTTAFAGYLLTLKEQRAARRRGGETPAGGALPG
ncbi:MAG TPA: hypothetical protein VFS08_12130 [Gemmatimonadaceae bacterium]|nr:hypothetical protein [Gemmatimonadaceae bacterium]